MINITQNNSSPISILHDIYNNDLLLNQYIIKTNGYFLFQLEKNIPLDPQRLLSLGNPYVLFYLVKRQKISYFFHGYVPKFLSNSFYNEEQNRFLNTSIVQLYTPVFQYFNRCWHHKHILASEQQHSKINLEDFSDIDAQHKILSQENSTKPFPDTGLIYDDALNDLFLFHTSYPKFRSQFYPNIPFDDNISFDQAFFMEKRDLIEEYENTSFFTTIELLFSNFYSDNQHLNLLPNELSENIISSQNIVSDYIYKNHPNYQHISSSHPSVQKALKSKKFDINNFFSLEKEHSLLMTEWNQNPAKIFYSFQEKTKEKVAIPLEPDMFNFIVSDLQGETINSESFKMNLFFHLLYMSPLDLAKYLLENDESDSVNLAGMPPFHYDVPEQIITSIIDNNFFFIPPSTPNSLTEKPLPINKKIWDILISSCSLFQNNILNFFIFKSYSQHNDIKIQMTLDLSHFESTFFLQSPLSKNIQSPLKYFKYLSMGIEFYRLFNMRNSDFTTRDLEIIKQNNFNIFSLVPLLGIDFFENNYEQISAVFRENILESIKNIDLNSNLKNVSFLSRTLGFLSPIPFFQSLANTPLIEMQTHDQNFEYLQSLLNNSNIKNTSFIHYLTNQLRYSYLSFNLMDKHHNYFFSPYNTPLSSFFNNDDLSIHQKILNTPYFIFNDNANFTNIKDKGKYLTTRVELIHFKNYRDLNMDIGSNDFQYQYLNSLLYDSINSFHLDFCQFVNIEIKDNDILMFSLSFYDYCYYLFEYKANIFEFGEPVYLKETLHTPEYEKFFLSLNREAQLRHQITASSSKIDDDSKTRKKI